MTFLDLFAGIGGFRRGLERSGHTCIGHVELDQYANQSYMAMYELEYCPYEKETTNNSCNMCKAEVSSNCDGKECKGEWYAKDIKQIASGEIPRAEIWTFGFPCTDISLSGKRAGLAGERSGLFFTVTGLLKSKATEDKPHRIIVENVKYLLSSKRGGDFTTVLFELWEAGYDLQWMCVNSKDFGVPQHRERVYLVGCLRGKRIREIFPVGRTNDAALKRIVGETQGHRLYDSRGLSITLTANGGGAGGKTGLYAIAEDWFGAAFIDLNENARLTQFARGIKAKQNAGISNHQGETSGVFLCEGKAGNVRAVMTPERQKKRQNGRRMKGVGEPSFTLTCQDQHGILLCSCNLPSSCGCVGKQCPQTLLDSGYTGVVNDCRIRRLTPRECWRLQAFEDELFDRARDTGMSDAQLYKQAGNAVTVNIVYEIGLRLGGLVHEV